MSSTNSTMGERIRSLREKMKLSQQELASMVPMGQAVLHNLEVGNSSKTGKIVQIANALNTTAEYLQTGKGFINETQSLNKIPVLKWNEIRKWIEYDKEDPLVHNEDRQFIYTPQKDIHSRYSYALKIESDTMQSETKESFNIGDYIIVDPEKKEKSGDFIIYNFPDYKIPIIRKLVIEGKTYLIPINSTYDKKTIEDTSQSFGVVVLKFSIFARI